MTDPLDIVNEFFTWRKEDPAWPPAGPFTNYWEKKICALAERCAKAEGDLEWERKVNRSMNTISDPCEHDFICTDKAKWIESGEGYNSGYFRRFTFHCRKCLKEEVKIRSEWTREAPDWWKGKEHDT